MRELKISAILVFGAGAALLVPPAAHADPATLPVKRIVLSSSGLVQIEREGDVEGNAEVDLPVPVDQVDDLLKSLAVFDAKGKVDSVRLAGKEPLAQAFRSLPFTEADLNSPEALLGAFRGAEVSISGPRSIHGRIVSVTPFTEKLTDNTTTTRHRLTILGSDGLQSTVLEDAEQVEFSDRAVQARLDKALTASLDSRAKDQRVIAVNLAGQGSRPVSLAYVVSAPIWKTSYRLILPRQGAKATLQGWAVLENMTGSDWDKVDLSIVSGNPVTFHQALYESYYVTRPDIPVQVYGRVMPRRDEGSIQGAPLAFAPAPAAAPAPRGLEEVVVTARRKTLAGGEQAVASAETGAQVSFHFPQPVSVAAGQSLAVPFIGRDIPVERVWLYQPEANADHPLTAVRLTNDGDAGLPAGILTVFEGDRDEFGGDAQFPNLPRGDNRMVSFALDQKTFITSQEKSDQTLASLTADRGVMHAVRKTVSDTIYTIKAPADEARTIVIEQPKRYNFTLEDPAGAEQTATAYRIRVSLNAGETKQVPVRLVSPEAEDIRIVSLDARSLGSWLESAGSLNDRAAVDALTAIAGLERAVSDAQARVSDIDSQRSLIVTDQERVRANLVGVPKESDLAKRYVGKLSDQETELSDLAKRRAAAQQDQVAAKAKLDAAIAVVKF
jgi:hypothetical protein